MVPRKIVILSVLVVILINSVRTVHMIRVLVAILVLFFVPSLHSSRYEVQQYIDLHPTLLGRLYRGPCDHIRGLQAVLLYQNY